MDTNRTVRDERGVTYTLSSRIAEGGQGAVFGTTTSGLLVKLRHASTSEDAERIRARLDLVRRLGLGDLAVIVPASRLAPPDVGYVMEEMTGMVPMSTLSIPRDADPIAWYNRETGGLRRRLILLAKLARTLAALHNRGLVYGDVSPTNLWVSADAKATEVRLIDLDNVVFSGADERTFTPHYGAPELELGEGLVSSLSDAYAFAVLAFEVLTLIHPLYGDLVQNGDPELELDARRGLLPWIDDPNDTTNASTSGLPRAAVLTKGLQKLAQTTFALGRGPSLTHRLNRPGLGAWADELELAADRTVICSNCHASYFAFAAQCPFCNAPRPACLMVDVFLVQPDREVFCDSGSSETLEFPPRPVARLFVTEQESRHLLARHALGVGDDAIVEIGLDASDCRVRKSGDTLVELLDRAHSASLAHAPHALTVGLQGVPIRLTAISDYALAFGTRDDVRRVACLSYVPGAAR
ncbi:MAG TPA: serine/threonine protein kinase [Myxococcota bacterium]|nr:serine/threonine protein kinase [Myxococcota bacterium]